jgi:hypothetical protein
MKFMNSLKTLDWKERQETAERKKRVLEGGGGGGGISVRWNKET